MNWRKVRDGCERDKRPMLLDPDPLPVLVSELPELPVKWVDHGVYELVHVLRRRKSDTLQTLEDGYYYSNSPNTPYSEHENIMQWVLRAEDYDHCIESCKACRLCCSCGCDPHFKRGDKFTS